MDLGELHPDWVQWSIHEGKIFAPEWRQGLAPGDIRALPYLFASVAEYRKQLDVTKKALQEMESLCIRAEHQARFYRSQLVAESRFGLMFARVTD